jgi:lipopolysaccharide biosynthesis glycosyltransferase
LRLSRHEFLNIRRDPDIIHFTSKHKPWHYLPEPQYKYRYWEALSRTPWKGAPPLGLTPRNVVQKIVKMKRLKQQIRLHGGSVIYTVSRLLGRRMLWSDVVPPPEHLIVA